MLLLAFGHTEYNTPTPFTARPLLGSHAIPLVSIWLGYRAGLPQTRYPLTCIRAFGIRVLIPAYYSCHHLLDRWSRGPRLPHREFVRPALDAPLVSQRAFRKGLITTLVSVQRLTTMPFLRATMDTVTTVLGLSLLGWSIYCQTCTGSPQHTFKQWVRWRPDKLALRPSRKGEPLLALIVQIGRAHV